jgi:hypothetical protein
MGTHLDRMVEIFGEETGCRMFRKVASWYARQLGPSAEFKRQLAGLHTRADLGTILVRYRAWRAPFLGPDGELLPQHRPRPASSSDGGVGVEGILVPRGPNEWW